MEAIGPLEPDGRYLAFPVWQVLPGALEDFSGDGCGSPKPEHHARQRGDKHYR
jgi:hypothetical protein